MYAGHKYICRGVMTKAGSDQPCNPVSVMQGSKKCYRSPGQVYFLSGQVTFKAYQMKNDPHKCEHNLCNCIRSLKKFRTSTGFEPMTLQYRCDPSNQLSYEATDEINHI